MGQKGKERNSSRSILFIVRKNLYSPFISDSRERFFIWSQFSPTKPITVNWYFEPSSPTSFRRHSPDGGFRVSIRTPSASPLLVQDMIVPCLETVVSVNWNTISYCAYIRIISTMNSLFSQCRWPDWLIRWWKKRSWKNVWKELRWYRTSRVVWKRESTMNISETIDEFVRATT